MTIRTVRVTAEWALQGKTERDRGYRLLRHSDGIISSGNFEEMLTRYSPGTLDDLPQVTFSWLSDGLENNYRAIAIHDDTQNRRDEAGRRVIFTYCFCMPVAKLAEEAVPYRAMYKGVREIQLPAADRSPLAIALPTFTPDKPVREQAFRVAALLLTGKPVVVLGADGTPLTDRLAFIDDVMALLPYGMRNRMSAATWTSATFRNHKFRLTFQSGQRMDGDDQTAIWDQPDDTLIEHPQARKYLDWLHGTDDAPARLAMLTEPMGFGQPDVLKILESVVRQGRQDNRGRPGPVPENPGGHVFISYVHEDASQVDQMQQQLELAGVRVWRDTADLWPGEDWRAKIRRAIQDEALVFIACFSEQSLAKPKSYQNAELALAIEQLQLRPPDDPWLIPVRLCDCEIPDRDIGAGRALASIQRADLFGERAAAGTARLVEAVLRILRRNARVTTRGESRPDPLTRSLTTGRATPEQVLVLFTRPAAEVSEAWSATTETRRDEALALLLSQPDQDVSHVLAARWDVVGSDVARLICRQLAGGEMATAASIFDALSVAGRPDMGDRLLAELLVPEGVQRDNLQRYMATVVSLLQQRPAPTRDTCRYSCAMLWWGNPADWQAQLVRLLLFRETAPGAPPSVTVSWLDWLCLTEDTPDWKRPDWVAGLSAMLPQPLSHQAVKGIRALVSTDYAWAAVILRAARQVRRLPQVLAVTDHVLVELIGRGIVSGKPPARGVADQILDALDTDLWQEGVPPEHIAAIDVVRILLGGKPRDFLADVGDEYVKGLRNVLALDAMNLLQADIWRWILTRALGERTPSTSAIMLFNMSATDDVLLPGLVELITGLSDHKRPYDSRLMPSFWTALASHPRLAGYASAGPLLAAAQAAARDPQAEPPRTADESGRSNTDLALACYQARAAGLPLPEVLRVLNKANISRIPACTLDDIIRTVQALSAGTGAVDGTDSWIAAEQDLFSCYEKIAGGVLGVEYGRTFKEHVTMRLRDEAARRRRFLRSFAKRNW